MSRALLTFHESRQLLTQPAQPLPCPVCETPSCVCERDLSPLSSPTTPAPARALAVAR